MTLEKSMYEYIKKEFPDAAFALFTGDIVDHGVHNTSREYNENISKLCAKQEEEKHPLLPLASSHTHTHTRTHTPAKQMTNF